MAKGGATASVVVISRIPELLVAMYAYHRMTIGRSADRIVAGAKARAPVQTGFLRSSIHKQVIHAGFEAQIMVDAPYAGFVEYGTVHMSARPFLYPAIVAEETVFFDDMSYVGFG